MTKFGVAVESAIDELYQGPLDQFVALRNALAKTLKGPESQRVKALQKPTVVPWAVNQVFWHARGLHERLIQSGDTLRAAQIAALEGRTADVRGATDAHRDAVAKATTKAMQLAAAAGAHPGSGEVGRMLEALSLASKPPDHPGRLTAALAPAGFEALGGIAVKAPVRSESVPGPKPALTQKPPDLRIVSRESVAARRAQKARGEKEAEAERQRSAAIRKAQSAATRARAAEARARETWQRTKRALDEAERKLSALSPA